MSLKNKAKAFAFISLSGIVPGSLVYLGHGLAPALVVGGTVGGFAFGFVAGISLAVIIIAEPDRFPDALQQMGQAILNRRTGRTGR